MLATYDGSIREARDLGEQALRELGDDPAARVVVRRRLALAHLLRAELADAERHAASAAKLAEPPSRASRRRARSPTWRASRPSAAVGPTRRRTSIARSRSRAPRVASIDDSPSAVAGLMLMYRGELAAARSRLRHALAQAQAAGGDPLSTGRCSRSASSRAGPGTSTRRVRSLSAA